ncbi:MAG: S8 family peptidase [Ignavibacteriae bacterium]|nr:S8 family peptidase [Ignavibacteriota bacterium]MCB9243222.1 S8 family peptidase [Ignavibacteriales bacterium]
MRKLLPVFLLVLFVGNCFAQNTEITERLQQKLQTMNPVAYVRTLVLLKDKVDIISLDKQLYEQRATLDLRARTVINTLQYKASQTQGPIKTYLENEKKLGKVNQYISYWITNMFFVEAIPEVIYKLALRGDVELLDLDAEIRTDEVIFDGIFDNTATVQPGLKVIKADSIWARGFTGQGRTVMNIDGGVNGTHVALGSRWWGNNGRPWYHSWLDPIAPVSTTPFDCGSHGTHTMGIMCGMEPGDTVGVAPDARWMAAGITDCPGASYPSMNILAYQWAMDPDSNVNTMDMPDAISCSWQDPSQSGSTQCSSTIYINTLTAVEAVGTAVMFSAGNSGPSASSITPPKNLSIDSVSTFAVGNINGNTSFPWTITSSSSRGPSICGGSGTLLIKPEVVAPGTSVRSTIPGGYGNMTGTSMASPHVGGSVALLRSVSPNLTGKQIKAILFTTATDLGTAGEDNTYGKGVINLNAAFMYMGPSIAHMPLLNTPNLSGPYTVDAMINTTVNPLNTSEIKLFWGRGTITDSISMTNSGGSNWTANIPGNNDTATYVYYIKAVDNQGREAFSPGTAPAQLHSFIANGSITNVTNNGGSIPVTYAISQNSPNPFNPTTKINFDIPVQSFVSITIYDMTGREITQLVNTGLAAGSYSTVFDGSKLASGVYYYRITAGSYVETKKMLLIK